MRVGNIQVFLEGASYAGVLRKYCQEHGLHLAKEGDWEANTILYVSRSRAAELIRDLNSLAWVTVAVFEELEKESDW